MADNSESADASAMSSNATSSIYDQICFSGESSCSAFRAHFLKPNMCTSCMKEIAKHSRESIPNEECVLKALEYTQKGLMVPTMILDKNANEGALYLGGFKAAINDTFLKEQNVTHIVNTASKGLGMLFGPKYREISKEVKEKLNITTLEMDWEDSMKFTITDEDFHCVVEFIESARKQGSVLVHCAQGKSRSGTAVCAYLMAKEKMEMIQAIKFIQEKRKMVDPNPNFRILLIKLEKSEIMQKLRKQLQN